MVFSVLFFAEIFVFVVIFLTANAVGFDMLGVEMMAALDMFVFIHVLFMTLPLIYVNFNKDLFTNVYCLCCTRLMQKE